VPALVSLGQGGHIILGFDEPVTDDPLNPEGFDFIVFGNAIDGKADIGNRCQRRIIQIHCPQKILCMGMQTDQQPVITSVE